jgi:hypothetical protein
MKIINWKNEERGKNLMLLSFFAILLLFQRDKMKYTKPFFLKEDDGRSYRRRVLND